MIIRKLAQKILFLSLIFTLTPYLKPISPLLMQTDYYPAQPLILAHNDDFDLDALQLRSMPIREQQQLATWQLFLIKVSCSIFVTASTIYDYIALKVAAIRNYLASKLSTSTTSTSTNVVEEHE